ncbi:dash complex subunit dad1 [Phaffia rhodozyma]|uniref:DASH complex subunit DAD1 n=1 Tax=Phaffia rhodozyma TaxID=264483 RepID=A0A0F7SIW7_PHARH|nr:dash complex subunit dad1 [Phaffia rhodozyma]
MNPNRKSLAPIVLAPHASSVAHSSSSSSAPQLSAQDSFDGRSPFDRERDRLLSEISKDFEEILGNANGYNRRLEEALQVGGGFKHMADLWGRFGELMREGKADYPANPDDTQITDASTSSVAQDQVPSNTRLKGKHTK